MSTASDVNLYERSNAPGKDPNVFLKKQWIQISDQQNGVYRANQSQIVTSSIANDSRYASYRDAFIAMPLVYSLSGDGVPDTTAAATSMDYSLGYKNGFLQMIHSIQVSLGGSTIVQQTSFANIWNHFKLMTTLSYGDVLSMGASIGFFPDDPLSIGFANAATTDGMGTCNNRNAFAATAVTGAYNSYNEYNQGLLKRQQYINYDPDGVTSAGQAAFSSLLSANACNNIYKSYVFKKANSGAVGVTQIAVMAILPLRQLHSFFDNMPLCKGVNMTITMTLNQTQVSVTTGAAKQLTLTNVTSQSSGTNPLMIASATASNGSVACIASKNIRASVFVGNQVQWGQQVTDGCDAASPFTSQVMLNVPVYTLDPVIEQAYMSSPIKRVMYTDIAQYLIQNISPNAQFNSIVTNSQAGLKSVLCVPYFTTTSAACAGVSPLLSPFDTAGATTSPLCLLNNFNVKISGDNALLDNALYTYQTFLEHMYGCNSYSAGHTYGMGGDGLISQLDFETAYCFHYVNVSRMPAMELSVGKSVQLLGVNQSAKAIDLYVFTEFGCSIDLDVLKGARVSA